MNGNNSLKGAFDALHNEEDMLHSASPMKQMLGKLAAAQNRERKRLLAEMSAARGLIPLLMKHRNGDRWTAQERQQLRTHMRQLMSVSPYLVVLVAPGGSLMLPALAWWLDRRRQRRADGEPMQAPPSA